MPLKRMTRKQVKDSINVLLANQPLEFGDLVDGIFRAGMKHAAMVADAQQHNKDFYQAEDAAKAIRELAGE